MIELNIQGMSCEHCQTRVKSLLENLEGVRECRVDLEQGKAYLEINGDETTLRPKAIAAINDTEVYTAEKA